jgi:hypothetical protein
LIGKSRTGRVSRENQVISFPYPYQLHIRESEFHLSTDKKLGIPLLYSASTHREGLYCRNDRSIRQKLSPELVSMLKVPYQERQTENSGPLFNDQLMKPECHCKSSVSLSPGKAN